MKVVIVGGVAGGATAAARIRRLDEQAEIIVFERSGYVSYANCGLPYYIGDTITDPEELTFQTSESFFSRFRVTMKVRHEVTAIHPDRKTVSVKDLETNEEFEESYDKLILSPGAKPTQPKLSGMDVDKLFTLRTVEDTFKVKNYVNENQPKSAVIAGGGFIGLELAENLRELGMDVTIVQSQKQLMMPFDADMAAFIHAEARKHGIRLALGQRVEGFSEKDGGVDVLLSGGEAIHGDLAVLAIGVTPDTQLAKDAGLELGVRGSIVVNDRMETSVPDIFAAGDAVQVQHFVTGEDTLISLAGPANKQGRIIADNICGGDSRYMGSQGSSVIKVFDLTAASTGINETHAKRAGLDVDTVILSPMSHAGYYPGGKVMTMKVVFEKETYRLLGAQIVGYEGVDKRIDVLATAIRAKMTAIELKDLDLAYAPPYSSAKDPVNMAGFMIDNLANGTLKQWHLADLEGLPGDGSVTLLDTRTKGEYRRGHIDGFLNIPVDELRERLDELDKDKPVYVICESGLRSYIACRILEGSGFTAYNFSGGFRLYDAVIMTALWWKPPLPAAWTNKKTPTFLLFGNVGVSLCDIITEENHAFCYHYFRQKDISFQPIVSPCGQPTMMAKKSPIPQGKKFILIYAALNGGMGDFYDYGNNQNETKSIRRCIPLRGLRMLYEGLFPWGNSNSARRDCTGEYG